MVTVSKFFPHGIFFILALASGFWLSHLGKPYNNLLFNIHKLIALGVAVATSVQVYRVLQTIEVRTALIGLIIVAALSVLALFLTGAFMSLGSPASMSLLTIHRVAPILAVGAVGWLLYLIIKPLAATP
jgi:hypothetical protein